MHSNGGSSSDNKRKNTFDNSKSAIKKIETPKGPGIYVALGKNSSGKIFGHAANKPVAIVNPRCSGQTR